MAARNGSRAVIDTESPDYTQFVEKLYRDRDRFWEACEQESDRGFVLIAASHFENKLHQSLLEYFISDQVAEELLNSNGGALGTFSAKLKCCLLLGIIEHQVFQILRTISKIRNRFAHEISVSLDDPVVTSQVDSLLVSFSKDVIGMVASETTKGKFSIICLMLDRHLFARPTEVAIYRSKLPDYIPTYISDPQADWSDHKAEIVK